MDAIEFQKLLEASKDYRVIGSPNPHMTAFSFDWRTIGNIMNLPFNCTHCGICCTSEGQNCSNLVQITDSTFDCGIYEKPNYPLSCSSYPFQFDEMAVEGRGCYFRMPQDMAREYKEYWELGLVSRFLMLKFIPTDPCWSAGGQPLRVQYAKTLRKLGNISGEPVNPPFDVRVMIPSQDGLKSDLVTYEEMEKSAQSLKRNLAVQRKFFAAKQAKIEHRDYSRGIR